MRARHPWALLVLVLTLWWTSPVPAAGADEGRDMVRRANESYRAGDFRECGRLYDEAVERGAGGSGVTYNAACCHALSGSADRAFALERGAIFHESPAEDLLHNLDYRKEILWL